MGRKFCVGGNWKMNGTKDSITELSKILTTGPLDPNVEVSARNCFCYVTIAKRNEKILIFIFSPEIS